MARRGYTVILRQLKLQTFNAFRLQVENGLENIFSLHFCWSQSRLTYYDSCGPNWRLRSYSSQASEGYKLNAECLFFEAAFFSLYCNF